MKTIRIVLLALLAVLGLAAPARAFDPCNGLTADTLTAMLAEAKPALLAKAETEMRVTPAMRQVMHNFNPAISVKAEQKVCTIRAHISIPDMPEMTFTASFEGSTDLITGVTEPLVDHNGPDGIAGSMGLLTHAPDGPIQVAILRVGIKTN